MPSLRPSLLSFLRSRPLRTPRFVTCPRSLSSATKTTTQGDGRRRLLVNAGVGFVGGIGVVLFMGWRNNVVEGFEGKAGTVLCESSSSDDLIHNRSSSEGEQIKQRTKRVGEGKSESAGEGEGYEPGRGGKEVDDPRNPMRIRMATWLSALQDHIVTEIEKLESTQPPSSLSPSLTSPTFRRDHWIRPNNGGEGASCVLTHGRIFEKGGVNVSIVQGKLPPAAIKQMKADHKSLGLDGEITESLPYVAMGISVILHPWNPHVPTVHMNYRYFEVDPPNTKFGKEGEEQLEKTKLEPGEIPQPTAWWFGGGSDLTPTYLYEEDAKHFHKTLKDAADRHHSAYYPAWKKWADKYFYIPHRGEGRGVGGTFFDDLTTESEIHKNPSEMEKGMTRKYIEDIERILPSSTPQNLDLPILPSSSSSSSSSDATHTLPTPSDVFSLVRTMSSTFLPSYLPIVKSRHLTPYTDEERRWQLLRRGRYVEFNLVNDRGTKFGMMSPGARIEAVLISLPETARWEYMCPLGAPGSGTREEELMKVLKEPREWV